MAPYDFSFEGREASAYACSKFEIRHFSGKFTLIPCRYAHTRRTRDDKPALKCVTLRKKPLVFRIQVLSRVYGVFSSFDLKLTCVGQGLGCFSVICNGSTHR